MAPVNYPIEKQALLQSLVEIRKRILDQCQQLDPEIVRTPFLGRWSIMELLAHLSGWDIANSEAAEAILAGRLPAFYEHHDKDWRTFNQLLVQRHLEPDLNSMLASLELTHQRLLAGLESIPPADFFQDFGLRFKGYKVILSRLLAAEAEDEEEHLKQMEAFIRNRNVADCGGSMPSV